MNEVSQDSPKLTPRQQQILDLVHDAIERTGAPPTRAEIAAELQIDSFLNKPLGDLSAGQRSRVALAKSLLNRPEILFLDEPTASLDPDTADWVRGYLLDYQRRTGATILLASHNMAEVERMASDVLIMRQGRVVDRGTPAALIARYGRDDLEQVFLDIARARTADGPPAGASDGMVPGQDARP